MHFHLDNSLKKLTKFFSQSIWVQKTRRHAIRKQQEISLLFWIKYKYIPNYFIMLSYCEKLIKKTFVRHAHIRVMSTIQT